MKTILILLISNPSYDIPKLTALLSQMDNCGFHYNAKVYIYVDGKILSSHPQLKCVQRFKAIF